MAGIQRYKSTAITMTGLLLQPHMELEGGLKQTSSVSLLSVLSGVLTGQTTLVCCLYTRR